MRVAETAAQHPTAAILTAKHMPAFNNDAHHMITIETDFSASAAMHALIAGFLSDGVLWE